MADQYGAITLPFVASPDFVDPLTYYIGNYLKAALNAQLGDAWAVIAPGKELIRSVFTADPAEVIFSDAALPALFVWSPVSENAWLGDDFSVQISTVKIFWLQPHDSNPKRERRMQFAGPLSKGVNSALIEGRHPAWVVAGDADPTAAKRGSLLMSWAGLIMWPEVRSEVLPVTMQIDGGDPVVYQAVIFTLKCTQRLDRSITDRSGRNPTIVSKLDLTVDQDGNTVESLIPPT